MKTVPVRAFSASLTALSLALAAPAYAQQSSPDSSTTDTKTDDFHSADEIVVTAPYVERLDLLSGTSAVTGDILAEKKNPPGSRREVTGDGIEQGRLASSIGAQNGIFLACCDAQAKVVDGPQSAKAARHATDLQCVARQKRSS